MKKRLKNRNKLVLVISILVGIVIIGLIIGININKKITGEVVSERKEISNVLSEYSFKNITRPKFNGYIIQFKDKSIIEKKVEIEKLKTKQQITQELNKHKTLLNSKHRIIKTKISQKLGKKDLKILSEYYNVFNGISLNITAEEARILKTLPEIKEIYPNYQVNITLMDSVPLINADDVWLLDEDGNSCASSGKPCLTGQGITIAIIDTGIDYTHPDLGGCFGASCKIISGWDFVNNDADPLDDYGHGTHVAGIAAGNGVLKGVAPNAKLYAYKVLSSSGRGTMEGVIAGIERAIDPNQDGDFSDHVDIISMSLGANCGGYYDEYCGPDDPVSQSVDNAVFAGSIVVVSAGNSGSSSETIGSPGTARKAITVGATYKTDVVASFSSRGSVLGDIKPDIVAPGVNICAAQWDSWLEGEYECSPNLYKHIAISGTSMAAPHVAGAAALLIQKYPNFSPEKIKSILMETAISDIIKENLYSLISGWSLYYSYYIPSNVDKICSKITFDDNVMNVVISLYWLAYAYYPVTLILRADSENNPGEIIRTSQNRGPGDIDFRLGNLLAGSYWVCLEDQPNPYYHVIFDYDDLALEKEHNTIDGLWHVIEGRDMQKVVSYYQLSPTDAFSSGAGRIDVLKAISTPVIATPNSYKFGINENTNQKSFNFEINIENLDTEIYTFDVSSTTSSSNIIVGITPNVLNVGTNQVTITFNSNSGNFIEGQYTGTIVLQTIENPNIILRLLYTLDIDYSPPVIKNIHNYIDLNEEQLQSQGISLETNEVSNTILFYRKKGTTSFQQHNSFGKNHNFDMAWLGQGEYEYYIKSTNRVGLASIDNNKGKYYTLVIPSYSIVPSSGFNLMASLSPIPHISSKILVGDLDHDSLGEIIYDTSSTIYIHESKSYNSYEATIPNIVGPLENIGDADSDRLSEILSKKQIMEPPYPYLVQVYESPNINSYPSNKVWEFNLRGECDIIRLYGLSISNDLDNDGKKEIIFFSDDDSCSSIFLIEYNSLYIYENTGDNSYSRVFKQDVFWDEFIEMDFGDLDNDGKKEIIAGTYYEKVYGIENNGNNIYEVEWIVNTSEVNSKEPIYLGDLDNDGKNEFFVYNSVYFPTSVAHFTIFEYKNSFLEIVWQFSNYDTWFDGNLDIAVGDIDNDGKNELIAKDYISSKGYGGIWIFKNVGDNSFIPIWYSSAAKDGRIGVGDSNGNGYAEIIFSKNNNLNVYEKYEACKDSDRGKNYQVKGRVELSTGVRYEDSCSGITLTENYCENNVRKTINFPCFKLGTGYKCIDGACKISVTTCTTGWKCKDSWTKAYQNSDCSWTNEQRCPIGCSNGACIATPVPEEV